MNSIITYGSANAIPFYNCTWKSSEKWWATGVKRQWLGYPIFITGVLIELLYIPVLYIIFKTNLIKHTCYKLMSMLALMDICATVCSSLITGILLIQGAVYCFYPTFIYISGGFVLSTWCASCALTVFLFLNRIISIALKQYAAYVEKRTAYTSMVFVVFYLLYINFFTSPILFNSEVMAWLPDPLSEPVPSEIATATYQNKSHDWNNWIYVFLMVILMTIYYVLVKKLAHGQKSRTSKAIFIQCCTICFFNTCVAVLYNAISLMTIAPWLVVFCQICWTVNHGVPALIYVTMNETIRREFLRIMVPRRYHRVNEKHSLAISTIITSRI